MLERQISLYPSLYETTPERTLTIGEFLELIKGGEWRHIIETARFEYPLNQARYKRLKNRLPGITPSGTFTIRIAERLIEHTGIIIVDIDEDQLVASSMSHDDVMALMEADEHCLYAFMSPSGVGVKAGFAVENVTNDVNHHQAYEAIKLHLARKNLMIDTSGKDVCRFCYVSYDPNAYVVDTAQPISWTHIPAPVLKSREGNEWFEGKANVTILQAFDDFTVDDDHLYDYANEWETHAGDIIQLNTNRWQRAEQIQGVVEALYPGMAEYPWMGHAIEFGKNGDKNVVPTPNKKDSRNEYIYSVACNWIRGGGTPEELLAIFESDRFEISDWFFTVRDKNGEISGPRPFKTAERERRRSIQRAINEVRAEELANSELAAAIKNTDTQTLQQKYEEKYAESRDKWEKILTTLESKHKYKPLTIAKNLGRIGIDEGLIVQTLGTYFLDEQLGKLAHLAKKALAEAEQERRAAMDDLEFMNHKHFRIRFYGNNSPVVTVKKDGSLVFQNHMTFEQAYSSEQVLDHDGKKTVSKGRWWLKHEQCRTYDEIVFDPEQPPETETTYNLWRGFPYGEKEGEIKLTEEYLRNIICNNDADALAYLWQWMAHVVQRPGKPAGVALVLRSDEEGTGKTFFAEKVCGALVGDNYRQIHEPFSKFNSDQQGAVVMFCDELVCTGHKKEESALKIMITANKRQFERKGFDKITQPNHLHMIIASNSEWVVPAQSTARRFFVLDVSTNRANDSEYFNAISKELDNGGYEILMHKLRKVKLTGNKETLDLPPLTSGLTRQKEESLNCIQSWWYEFLQAGNAGQGWPEFIETAALYELYRAFHEEHGGWEMLETNRKFGLYLKKMCPSVKRTRCSRLNEKKLRPWGYSLPSLEESRKAWEKALGMKPVWLESIDDLHF